MPEQVAVIESLILANDLSDRAISEELATRGITASKECVASRRRRLGMSHDLTSLPVLVKAATILEATRTLSQGIVVDFTPPIPAIPTNAPPGSRRKVAVLAERIRSGMPLWHTEDCHVMEPPSD